MNNLRKVIRLLVFGVKVIKDWCFNKKMKEKVGVLGKSQDISVFNLEH